MFTVAVLCSAWMGWTCIPVGLSIFNRFCTEYQHKQINISCKEGQANMIWRWLQGCWRIKSGWTKSTSLQIFRGCKIHCINYVILAAYNDWFQFLAADPQLIPTFCRLGEAFKTVKQRLERMKVTVLAAQAGLFCWADFRLVSWSKFRNGNYACVEFHRYHN